MLTNESTKVPPYRRLITGTDKFAPGYRVQRPDGSGDGLFMLTLSGSGFFQGSGIKNYMKMGSVAWIPQGTPHDYGIEESGHSWTLIWAHVHPWPHWDELLRWPQTKTGACVLMLDDSALLQEVTGDIRLMHNEAASAHPLREVRAMHALEQALLRCDRVNPRQAANRTDPRIQKSVECIHARLAEPLTIEDLGHAAGLSPSRFAHLFTEQMGVSPLQYVEKIRIDRARDLLALTSRPIAELAEEVGFPSPYYFSRRFSKTTGLCPRDYRRKITR